MFVIGNFGPALALDRMGRRKTMIWGCLGLGICMTCAAGLLAPEKEAASKAAVAFFFLWMLIFGGTSKSFFKLNPVSDLKLTFVSSQCVSHQLA